MSDESAAARAAAQVQGVVDDPEGRMALLSRTYARLCGGAPRYERAALSFMRWQAVRGVLRPLGVDPPGSPWWRAVNARLLLDGCEAVERWSGRGGEPSSATIEPWSTFIRRPTPRTWYRAHNATIVAAYLAHRDLASGETPAERFFLDVALLRVLYVHALIAAPGLALGRFGFMGRLVGDPRGGTVDAYLSLGRVLPDRYPLREDLRVYLVDEHGLGRAVDYGVIVPRIGALYDWSAAELDQPGLRELARDGRPVYAWPYEDDAVWTIRPEPWSVRFLRRATSPR